MLEAMDAIAVILGGGEGKRLQPLTKFRCKPAVPLAGKYRLVDIPISNCLNSQIRRMFLLTQFNSVSLHEHIQNAYRFDQFNRSFVRILAAQQGTREEQGWFQGTADAVRQNLSYFLEQKSDVVVILSGDQLYRMNFQDVILRHQHMHADITICAKPVPRKECNELGIMKIDPQHRITQFWEKPGGTADITSFRIPENICKEERYLANLGIYIFNTTTLKEILETNKEGDFGKHIIPGSITKYNVCADLFDGYWKDIGTIGGFWETNLALTDTLPEFSFYDFTAPVYTHMRFLPPSKIICCDLSRSLLAEGCIISSHRILHSIIGLRQIVGSGTVIEHSVIMGADYYDAERPMPGSPPVGIGQDCYIRNAIIDKNARIGNGVYITPDGKKDGAQTDQYWVRDGVIVIPKSTIIPDGTHL